VHDTHVTVAGRRVLVRVPAHAGQPPLLLILHGYGSHALQEERYLELRRPAERAGMIEVLPDGTPDSYGKRFWNATPACCGAGGPAVDDSRFLGQLVATVARRYGADRKRIFAIGLSNGGFMAHRLACDHARSFAAIVSLAGAGAIEAADCQPSQPVSILEVHGSADSRILYGGGVAYAAYPGTRRTVADWARRNRCAARPRAGRLLHLATRALADDPSSRALGPHETTVTTYAGCAAGGHVELWTMRGADHVPALTPDFGARAVAFLLAHPKP
jgi:polyhydroxybutyrate depolymerase